MGMRNISTIRNFWSMSRNVYQRTVTRKIQHTFLLPKVTLASISDLPRQGHDEALQKAAEAVRHAHALIITAGAGMGVDSGLPQFSGPQGFWKEYPLLKAKGISLAEMSNPDWFARDPESAWWSCGHRYNLYAATTPHEGFDILKRWADKMDKKYFVYTSNVDGHFQKAGFDEERVVECHGSINFMQCFSDKICNEIWPVPENTKYELDNDNMKMLSPLPTGPPGEEIQHPARPNIFMFSDYLWLCDRTSQQKRKFDAFRNTLNTEGGIPFVVIEIGAGHSVPTIRRESEGLVGRNKGTLIRINPTKSEVPKWPENNVSLPLNGLEALKAIDKMLEDNP